MSLFLVCLVLTAVAAGELEETGLYHNYNTEYAPTYHNYEPRDYHFEYGVSDPHTGDHKSQWETKDKAGVVRGGYSLLEPDGTTRIVEYIADDHGFRAVVKKLGTSIHPEHVEVHGHTSHEHQQQELPHLSSPIVVADDIEPLTEAPIYQSYDGHVDNYANVLSAAVKHLEPISYGKAIEIPHTEELHGYQHIPQQNYYPQQEVFSPKAQGVYFDAPRHQESIGSFGPNVLIPKAEGIYPQAPIKAPVILPEQHQQYILEQPQYKVAPVYTQNLEQRVLEQPRYEQSQYKVSPVYAQNLEQRILEQPKIALTGYEQPQYKVEPVYQHSLQQRVPLAYSQGPQQIYGGAGHQQEIYQEPINIQHPHGESSGQYHGITNNPEDDSAYTQYGGHRQQELNNDYEGEYTQGVPKYLSVPSKRQAKALPYNFVVKHPILH